jgi:hypothetical protein
MSTERPDVHTSQTGRPMLTNIAGATFSCYGAVEIGAAVQRSAGGLGVFKAASL